MNAAKHTTGPWHVADKSARGLQLGIYDAKGDLVATGAICGPITLERRVADGRLIASAPELLEALKDAKRQIVGLCTEGDVPDSVNAAIAKATGSAS